MLAECGTACNGLIVRDGDGDLSEFSIVVRYTRHTKLCSPCAPHRPVPRTRKQVVTQARTFLIWLCGKM